MKDIYSQVKESGYISSDQKKEMTNINYATQKKMKDIQAGKYKDINKEVAEEMIITAKMSSWLQDKYGGR